MTESNAPVVTRAGEEVWELNVPGRVGVSVTNEHGRTAERSVRGKGSRLRISTIDRQIAEEKMRGDEHNPFRNGTMRQVAGPGNEGPTGDQLSDEQLIAIFGDAKDEEFRAMLEELSQVNVRRMKALCTSDGTLDATGKVKRAFVDATMSQVIMINELIQERWPIGGSTPTYDEMQRTPSAFGG